MPERGHVAGYWAVDGEIGLHAWQLRLPPSLTYCLPVLHEDRLRFAPWRAGDALLSNRYGIPEPDIAPGALLAAEAIGRAHACNPVSNAQRVCRLQLDKKNRLTRSTTR